MNILMQQFVQAKTEIDMTKFHNKITDWFVLKNKFQHEIYYMHVVTYNRYNIDLTIHCYIHIYIFRFLDGRIHDSSQGISGCSLGQIVQQDNL